VTNALPRDTSYEAAAPANRAAAVSGPERCAPWGVGVAPEHRLPRQAGAGATVFSGTECPFEARMSYLGAGCRCWTTVFGGTLCPG
jgi:hypothetical protein